MPRKIFTFIFGLSFWGYLQFLGHLIFFLFSFLGGGCSSSYIALLSFFWVTLIFGVLLIFVLSSLKGSSSFWRSECGMPQLSLPLFALFSRSEIYVGFVNLIHLTDLIKVSNFSLICSLEVVGQWMR